MPDRVKLCEWCGRTWYEEEQDEENFLCLDDGSELRDIKLVYTHQKLIN